MSEKKLGQSPAFGQNLTHDPDTGEAEVGGMYFGEDSCGMSKRFYAACAAIQGLLANEALVKMYAKRYPESAEVGITKEAYEFADELLRQEANDE